MAKAKIAIVYYSTYGTNHQMAESAAEAAREAGAEVKLLKVNETAPASVVEGVPAWAELARRTAEVPEATPDDLIWADGFLFSSPTRFGGAASQMRAFMDTLGPIWQKGLLANKTFSAMSSAMNPHGGQETTLLTLYISAMHWGAILVPPGYTDQAIYDAGGNPYGVSVTAGRGELGEETKAAIRAQAKRLVEITGRLIDRGARP